MAFLFAPGRDASQFWIEIFLNYSLQLRTQRPRMSHNIARRAIHNLKGWPGTSAHFSHTWRPEQANADPAGTSVATLRLVPACCEKCGLAVGIFD